MIKRYVRVTDDSHPQYSVYEGYSLKNARLALRCVERTLYAMLGTAAVVHNLDGEEAEQEWQEGCPPDNSSIKDFSAGRARNERIA